MSKIEELIQKLCPDGVEYKKLGDCINSLKTGLNPRKFFKLNEPDSCFPYITGKDIFNNKVNITPQVDKISARVIDVINKRANLKSGDLLFASTGTGTVGRMAVIKDYQSNWAISETLYAIDVKDSLMADFLMYYLYSEGAKKQFVPKISKGSVPHLKVKDLLDLVLPVPPIEIQQEIVRILDKFTSLSEKLNAELELRKKQYKYYREKLLSFEGKDVKWKPMGEIGEFIRGNGLQKNDFVESGVGCIHYGQIYTYYGMSANKTKSFISHSLSKKLKKAHYGDIILTTTSENVEDVCKAVAWLGLDDICIGGHSCLFRHSQNPKFISYFTQTYRFLTYKQQNAVGVKVIDVSCKKLETFPIPVPFLAEQERIVSILDKFDTLVNDQEKGLPAEIRKVQKQYEYYRDKLLTFLSTQR